MIQLWFTAQSALKGTNLFLKILTDHAPRLLHIWYLVAEMVAWLSADVLCLCLNPGVLLPGGCSLFRFTSPHFWLLACTLGLPCTQMLHQNYYLQILILCDDEEFSKCFVIYKVSLVIKFVCAYTHTQIYIYIYIYIYRERERERERGHMQACTCSSLLFTCSGSLYINML